MCTGKRIFSGMIAAAKDDLKALGSFPSSEDAIWKVLFSTPVITVALVVMVLGFLAFLPLVVNMIAWASP